jgi:ABC-type polar amino acid transport system ATPase subunit
MTETPMIRMASVDKHFGDLHVLRDINLEVAPGQVVVVLGPSGSGKSTLCRTINHAQGTSPRSTRAAAVPTSATAARPTWRRSRALRSAG